MGERGDVTCSKGPGFEPQLAAYVYVLNFAMPWPPHTSFVSHLGHPSKNVLDTPLLITQANVTYIFFRIFRPSSLAEVAVFALPQVRARIEWLRD